MVSLTLGLALWLGLLPAPFSGEGRLCAADMKRQELVIRQYQPARRLVRAKVTRDAFRRARETLDGANKRSQITIMKMTKGGIDWICVLRREDALGVLMRARP